MIPSCARRREPMRRPPQLRRCLQASLPSPLNRRACTTIFISRTLPPPLLPSRFITGFVGQASGKTREIFESALGKVRLRGEEGGEGPPSGARGEKGMGRRDIWVCDRQARCFVDEAVYRLTPQLDHICLFFLIFSFSSSLFLFQGSLHRRGVSPEPQARRRVHERGAGRDRAAADRGGVQGGGRRPCVGYERSNEGPVMR